MQTVLKGLHSTDIADVETCLPDEEDNFGFVLRAMVGTSDGEGQEGSSDVLLGLHKFHFPAAGSTSSPELIRQRSAWTDDANLVVDKSSVHLRNFNLWHVTARAVLSAYGTRRTRTIAYRP